MRLLARLRRLFRRHNAEQDTRLVEGVLDERPFPVLDGLDPFAGDTGSAEKLLTLASFVATLVDTAGDGIDEENRGKAVGLVLFATSQAAAAKLEIPQWTEALWRGRDIFLWGPDEERLALLAAAEVLLLDVPSEETSVQFAEGLLPHFRGRLTEGLVTRFVELRIAARELRCLQTVGAAIGFYGFISLFRGEIDELFEKKEERSEEGPEPIWPDLFPWHARAGVA